MIKRVGESCCLMACCLGSVMFVAKSSFYNIKRKLTNPMSKRGVRKPNAYLASVNFRVYRSVRVIIIIIIIGLNFCD
jgi:hypothetical protein